ncbi:MULTISPECIES: metallophosphoesterase family protein [unclassified Saccharicrinis]|uniref:metallophosphoesterase family protein n=1 Tax=unclassified Saccharicrinis TaxID=2646859 RepID=UPI003D3439F3
MKILHTADWHTGKKLESFTRIEEQTLVLDEICNIADSENVNAVIISGDLFDTFNPSSEAIELFYKTLKKLSKQGLRPVIAISGNHDSPDRIETADPLARECGIVFLGYPNSKTTPFVLESGLRVSKSEEGFIEFNLPYVAYPLRVITTPYANEYRMKQALDAEDKEADLRDILQKNWHKIAGKNCDDKGVNILATHLFVINKGETPQNEPEDEKPILHVGGAQAIYTSNFPKQIQYVALGHLHRQQIIASTHHPVVYSGSPLSYSFAEADQKKYVMIVDVEPNQEARVKPVELILGKKLLRIVADGMEDAEAQLKNSPNCLIELTLKTDEYISAKERQHLHQIHEGIVTLIPQFKNREPETRNHKNININKDIRSLFSDYFKHSNGIDPGESILNLLDEVIAQKDSNA